MGTTYKVARHAAIQVQLVLHVTQVKSHCILYLVYKIKQSVCQLSLAAKDTRPPTSNQGLPGLGSFPKRHNRTHNMIFSIAFFLNLVAGALAGGGYGGLPPSRCLNKTGVDTLVNGYTYLLEHPLGPDFNSTADAILSDDKFQVLSDSILTLSQRPVSTTCVADQEKEKAHQNTDKCPSVTARPARVPEQAGLHRQPGPDAAPPGRGDAGRVQHLRQDQLALEGQRHREQPVRDKRHHQLRGQPGHGPDRHGLLRVQHGRLPGGPGLPRVSELFGCPLEVDGIGCRAPTGAAGCLRVAEAYRVDCLGPAVDRTACW